MFLLVTRGPIYCGILSCINKNIVGFLCWRVRPLSGFITRK